MEENNVQLAITPFEKNIEIWKQLWRVIEKSELLLQIVDARNPYFFYCPDLEQYIRDVGQEKQFILLINKADYLTPELAAHWSQYFNERGVKHVFFSAKKEQDRIDAANKPVILADETSSDDEAESQSDDDAQDANEDEAKEEGQAMGAFAREFKQQMEKDELKEMKKPRISDSDDEAEPVQYNTPQLLSRG